MLDERLCDATVVVIDDVGPNARLLESSLKTFGLRDVHSFTDPIAGLQWLQKNPWDLLLLDLDMPKLHGLDLLQQLGSDERPPVIIITALSSMADRHKGLALGANDYICKPLDLSEVLLRIRNNLQLSLAWQNIKLERDNLDKKVLQRTQQLQESFAAVIHTLTRASAFKDNETGNHITRIGTMSALIAEHIGAPEFWIEQIRLAAPMHDVGKIGIPDAILNKQGSLDNAERSIMNTHAQIGYEILFDQRKIPLINMAAEIALYHHEHWNGAGYPQGLKGETIPLSARIVALCDVYDALRSVRPYKTPWTQEQALNHIRTQAGLHFDPELVETFIARIADIENIIATQTDTPFSIAAFRRAEAIA